MSRQVVLLKNAAITCPGCDQFLALAKRDVYDGDPLLSETFEYPTHQYKNGDAAKCFQCGKDWFNAKTGQIHTSKGWLPKLAEGTKS